MHDSTVFLCKPVMQADTCSAPRLSPDAAARLARWSVAQELAAAVRVLQLDLALERR